MHGSLVALAFEFEACSSAGCSRLPDCSRRQFCCPDCGSTVSRERLASWRSSRSLNALVVPAMARVRLPFTVVSGFLLVLALDAALLWIAADAVADSITIDSFGWALAGALAAAAATLAFQIALGVNNDDAYSLRVIERMARRSGEQVRTDTPGIVFVEIDGLAFPVLQRAIRDGHTPEMARWLAAGTHTLVEWETDLSSQTGASQAGSCSARTTTSPPSAGSRRRPAGRRPARRPTTARRSSAVTRPGRVCSPTAERAGATSSPVARRRQSSR